MVGISFGCSELHSLGFLLQVLPSFNVGGLYGMFGWWVWLVSQCFGGIVIHTDTSAVVGRQVVDIVIVLGSSLPLSLSLFLWVGASVAWAHGWLGGVGRALYGREELLLHLGDSGT